MTFSVLLFHNFNIKTSCDHVKMLMKEANHFLNLAVSKPNKSQEQTCDCGKMLMIAANHLKTRNIDADSNKTKKCSHCGNNNSKTYKYNSPPCFRMIGFTANSQDIDVSKTLTLASEAGPVTLPIRGVIYYTGNHFVSRLMSPTGEVWYHDGIETKRQCACEGHLIDFTENSLKIHGSKRCVGVVYSV